MSSAIETDLLARCLSGDYQSRVQLYRQFVYGSPRVRRHGARYSNLSDFLHDCFANVLDASQDQMADRPLADRVEWIASWTALERDRLRDIDVTNKTHCIRMCASLERDAPGDRMASYVPPRCGDQDTLHARLAAVCGDLPFKLIRARAVENAAWDDLAESVLKPVNFVGPLLVRAIDRLTRLFGAPPPLNADFEPIFCEVGAKDARSRHSNPGQPRGRVIAMQLDPEFYPVTPDLRRLGLRVPSDVRTFTLWDAARSTQPPGDALRGHLAVCRYCSEVFRALLLMHQAVCSPPNADYLLCPGASTLLLDAEEAGEACQQHVRECEACRNERTEALGVNEVDPATAPQAGTAFGSWKKITAWASAGLVMVTGVLFAVLYHPKPQAKAVSPAAEAPQISGTSKYRGLAQTVNVNNQNLMASVLPANQLTIMEALNNIQLRNRVKAKMLSEQTVNLSNDPGARMLLAICLYLEQRPSDGYREMQASEATLPRNAYRCWTLLQCALTAGDAAVAEREIGHLANDPEYGPRAKEILTRMHAIK